MSAGSCSAQITRPERPASAAVPSAAPNLASRRPAAYAMETAAAAWRLGNPPSALAPGRRRSIRSRRARATSAASTPAAPIRTPAPRVPGITTMTATSTRNAGDSARAATAAHASAGA